MRESTRTLLFAAAVCLVCSLLLSTTSALLRERQERNRAFDRLCNILKVLDIPLTDADGKRITPAEAERVRTERIMAWVLDAETLQPIPGLPPEALTPQEQYKGTRLPVYRLNNENGHPLRYALPIAGKGLWGMMYGYLALDADLSTIAGITFYQHKETPGLGAEIEQAWFQKAFVEKKIREADGSPARFELVKGGVENRYPQGNAHAVDAISGATMTSRGVEELINAAVMRYEPWFKTIREARHVP
jgi:Na+-transporting NADH:ubiquinone oxidoreductase subunit C